MTRIETLVKEVSIEEMEDKIVSNFTTEEANKLKEIYETYTEEKIDERREEGTALALKWAAEHDHLPDEELIIGTMTYLLRKVIEWFSVNE